MNNTIYHCSECGVREHQNKDHVECYKFFNNVLPLQSTHTHTRKRKHAKQKQKKEEKKWNDKGNVWRVKNYRCCCMLFARCVLHGISLLCIKKEEKKVENQQQISQSFRVYKPYSYISSKIKKKPTAATTNSSSCSQLICSGKEYTKKEQQKTQNT